VTETNEIFACFEFSYHCGLVASFRMYLLLTDWSEMRVTTAFTGELS